MAAATEVAHELQSDNRLIQMYAVFYCGLFGYGVLERKPFPYTFRQVAEWVDKLENKYDIYGVLLEGIKVASPEFKAAIDTIAETSEEKKTELTQQNTET